MSLTVSLAMILTVSPTINLTVSQSVVILTISLIINLTISLTVSLTISQNNCWFDFEPDHLSNPQSNGQPDCQLDCPIRHLALLQLLTLTDQSGVAQLSPSLLCDINVVCVNIPFI